MPVFSSIQRTRAFSGGLLEAGAAGIRHHCGDWGDLDECDKQANEDAMIHGDRILSHYKLGGGWRIYIITEAGRQSTCILLPEEY